MNRPSPASGLRRVGRSARNLKLPAARFWRRGTKHRSVNSGRCPWFRSASRWKGGAKGGRWPGSTGIIYSSLTARKPKRAIVESRAAASGEGQLAAWPQVIVTRTRAVWRVHHRAKPDPRNRSATRLGGGRVGKTNSTGRAAIRACEILTLGPNCFRASARIFRGVAIASMLKNASEDARYGKQGT